MFEFKVYFYSEILVGVELYDLVKKKKKKLFLNKVTTKKKPDKQLRVCLQSVAAAVILEGFPQFVCV